MEELCAPRYFPGDPDPYYCGRQLRMRNVEDRAERCLGGTFICPDCFTDFEDFMDRIDDAKRGES